MRCTETESEGIEKDFTQTKKARVAILLSGKTVIKTKDKKRHRRALYNDKGINARREYLLTNTHPI